MISAAPCYLNKVSYLLKIICCDIDWLSRNTHPLSNAYCWMFSITSNQSPQSLTLLSHLPLLLIASPCPCSSRPSRRGLIDWRVGQLVRLVQLHLKETHEYEILTNWTISTHNMCRAMWLRNEQSRYFPPFLIWTLKSLVLLRQRGPQNQENIDVAQCDELTILQVEKCSNSNKQNKCQYSPQTANSTTELGKGSGECTEGCWRRR